MCDYSLEMYRSRPAQLGERYETHQFQSRSIGFIAPGDPSTAVCMACDTKLALEDIVARGRGNFHPLGEGAASRWRALCQ